MGLQVSSVFARWLRNLSIRKKFYFIVGILVIDLVTVISLSIFGMGVLSQVRSYVGGEGLWAKAQKNAVFSLTKYALSGREKDYQDYLHELKVPLGDRKARLELMKPRPDLQAADQAFLEGQNHPQDLRGMSKLFIRFNRFSQIARAIRIWGEADAAMLELQELGSRFHALGPAQRAGKAATADFIQKLDALNDRLTGLENDFSRTMGEAARWAKRLLVWVMVLGSLGVGILSVLAALYFSRSIVSGVTRIGAAAARAAKGEMNVKVSLGTSDELGRLAEAFNAMTRDLSRIDEIKNNFVSNVSHELRTPLTLNLAPLESLLGGEFGALPDAQRRQLTVIYNNALRLLQMVNGLLDFSKLEAGKMPVVLEGLDICALTESLIGDFRPSLAAKGLELRLRLDPRRPLLMMDRNLYERILFNLLSNALKFTPKGGEISVELAYQGGLLGLSVADSGIGISAEDAKGLFQKFSQAEASSTRRFEGTGLGLALVRECCELLGGGVTLQSSPGAGSTFSVQLPAAPATAAAPEAAPEAGARRMPVEEALAMPEPRAQDKALPRLIVAEDNPELAAFMVGLLAGLCQVKVCVDGQAALAEAQSWAPDLVLSDVMMPLMDGISLCREIKRAPKTAGIPVVLLTALTSQQDLLKGWEAGADDYLFKPFHPRELQARVRTMLSMVAWRRRSEEQRKRQEILELFTRIASHDLKAPLRRISSYAELLRHDLKGGLGAEGANTLQVIEKSAAQMHSLIESLIQFTRLESGEQGFRPCELSAVLREVGEFLAPAIAEQGAKLDAGPLPRLRAVPAQAFALFQNLIGNSLKYKSPLRPPRITVKAELRGEAWQFTFSDNGIGFDPAYKEDVFDMFKRLQESSELPGEGMGLAIARKIVEIHGGRIWAEPVPGQGCSIHFTLPAEAGASLQGS